MLKEACAVSAVYVVLGDGEENRNGYDIIVRLRLIQ
jgi:hypothetical protein